MTEIAGKDSYLGRRKRRYIEHDVEGFGGVRIQRLTERELQEFLRYGYETDEETGRTVADQDKLDKSNCKLLVMTLVDSNGFSIFQDSDIDELAEVDCSITREIFRLADKHCSTNRDPAVESAVGNSEGTEGEG